MDVDVSELNRLAFDLGKAGIRVTGQVAKVIRKSAMDIEATAKVFAPVDTGNLRNSISSTVRGLNAEIGPTASYGGFVEWGTARMGPHAYMGPALDRHTPALVTTLEQAVGDVL